MLNRYALLMERYRTLPVLVVEDAGSGTQLIDTIRSRDSQIPLIAAKPVKAKVIRAEGVTPMTTAGLVALPRNAPWRADFVKEMGDFPVGQHDDVPDAFCHGMKAFTTARDFKTPDLTVMPGHLDTEYEALQREAYEDWKYERESGLGEDF